MKRGIIISIIFGLIGICLFTILLVKQYIGEAIYGWLLCVLALVCIVILVFPRLQELDLKNLKLTLNKIKQIKSEIEEIYGGIDNLKKEPLILDDDKMKELGLKGGFAVSSAVMRYPAGCIKRERERLARIFVTEKSPEKIAEAILDNSLDDKVFKWNGPETPLDAEPKSVDQRLEEKQEENSKNKATNEN
ncbi:hypothetical protein ACFL02_01955 [Planctomycetota bacterium]